MDIVHMTYHEYGRHFREVFYYNCYDLLKHFIKRRAVTGEKNDNR